MCLLTISVKNTRPEIVKLAKIAINSRFSRLELVWDRTFERKVMETSEILENDFGGVGACSCSLNTCSFRICNTKIKLHCICHFWIINPQTVSSEIHSTLYIFFYVTINFLLFIYWRRFKLKIDFYIFKLSTFSCHRLLYTSTLLLRWWYNSIF